MTDIFEELPDCSEVVRPFHIPTSSVEHSDLYSSSLRHVIIWFFYYSVLTWCAVVYNCGFVVHFLNDSWCWTSFRVLFLVINLSFLEKYLFKSFACFLFCWVMGVFFNILLYTVFWTSVFTQIGDLQIFSPITSVALSLCW
jgi:hypothetical protein